MFLEKASDEIGGKSMPLKRCLTVILIMVLVFAVGCTSKKEEKSSLDIKHQDEITEPHENSPDIPKVENPLTGTDMDTQFENQRPLAVMIENEYNARPQSGLSRAGVVYEVLAEGGITRFLALFLGETLDEIGPVRSARPYFLDYAMEYDSIYVHYGASPQGYIDLKQLQIDAIDGIYDDITFWRDKSRKAPHNAYTSVENILKTSGKRRFRKDTELTFWKFNSEESFTGDVELENFELDYFSNYTVKYTYNHDKKVYERFINGKPHTDRNTGESIFVKNIIITFASTRVLDDVGRLSIKTTDSGNGYYISNGYCSNIKWRKDARNQRTNYTFQDGSNLVINPGNTWIQVLPQWGKFRYD